MTLRRIFIAGLLGCTILAGCDASDDKPTDTSAIDQSIYDNTAKSAVLNDNIAKLQKEVVEIKRTTTEIASADETRIKELGDEIITRKTALEDAKRISTQTITGLDGDMKRLQRELDGLTAKATQKSTADEARIKELGDEIAERKKTFEEAKKLNEEKIASLAGDVKRLQKEFADLERTAAAKGGADKTRIAALEEELAAQKTSIKPVETSKDKNIAKVTGKEAAVAEDLPQDLAKYINTMRGANSSGDFTRGNTFPATAVPFGFNFWTPVNRDDNNWFYQFRSGECGSLLDKIMGFAVVHMPSPWIGNRQSLQIMPIADQAVTSKAGRAQRFQRKNEIAKAHCYSLTFDNGTRTEITPTDHAAFFRFTAPADQSKLTLLFDYFKDNGGDIRIDQANNIVSGTSSIISEGRGSEDGDSERYGGVVRTMYFYAKFDARILPRRPASSGSASLVQFNTPADQKIVGMKIATSFISAKQARDNLEQELAARPLTR